MILFFCLSLYFVLYNCVAWQLAVSNNEESYFDHIYSLLTTIIVSYIIILAHKEGSNFNNKQHLLFLNQMLVVSDWGLLTSLVLLFYFKVNEYHGESCVNPENRIQINRVFHTVLEVVIATYIFDRSIMYFSTHNNIIFVTMAFINLYIVVVHKALFVVASQYIQWLKIKDILDALTVPQHYKWKESCTICKNYLGLSKARDLCKTACNHIFHTACLKDSITVVCPECKTALAKEVKLTSECSSRTEFDLFEWNWKNVSILYEEMKRFNQKVSFFSELSVEGLFDTDGDNRICFDAIMFCERIYYDDELPIKAANSLFVERKGSEDNTKCWVTRFIDLQKRLSSRNVIM